MGEIGTSNLVPSMEQRMLSLKKMLKKHQESHQQQLTSFLAANAALREENATLRAAVMAPCHDGPIGLQSLSRLASTNEPPT